MSEHMNVLCRNGSHPQCPPASFPVLLGHVLSVTLIRMDAMYIQGEFLIS